MTSQQSCLKRKSWGWGYSKAEEQALPRFSLSLQKPRERPSRGRGESVKSEKTAQPCEAGEETKAFTAVRAPDPEVTPALFPQAPSDPGDRQRGPRGHHRLGPSNPRPLCSWWLSGGGPGKAEKLGLTLQNNAARVGWGGGGTPQRSECARGLSAHNGPSEARPRGTQRRSLDVA